LKIVTKQLALFSDWLKFCYNVAKSRKFCYKVAKTLLQIQLQSNNFEYGFALRVDNDC
jgi:hypothetical protein